MNRDKCRSSNDKHDKPMSDVSVLFSFSPVVTVTMIMRTMRITMMMMMIRMRTMMMRMLMMRMMMMMIMMMIKMMMTISSKKIY